MRKHVITYFTGKIIPALANLALIILVVRTLGEAEYGKYSLVFYATMLVSTLTFGWIQQSTLRFLSAYNHEIDTVIQRFFHLTLFSALASAVIMLPVSVFYFELTGLETGIVLSYAFLYNFYWFNLTLNQAETRSLRFAVLEGSYNILYIGILLLFLFVFRMKWFAVLFLSMSIGLVFTEVIRISMPASHRFRLNLRHYYWDAGFTKKMLDFGFTLTFWLFISYIVTIADRFIIKEFYSYSEVGVYSAVKDFIIKIATFATADPGSHLDHPGGVCAGFHRFPASAEHLLYQDPPPDHPGTVPAFRGDPLQRLPVAAGDDPAQAARTVAPAEADASCDPGQPVSQHRG
jgi:O-antigen/teichoic acid export membrane protein